MGQAKARREALRQQMLEEGKRWDFPPTPWEAAICAELKDESRVVAVSRAPADQLAWMRMPDKKCHDNVRRYVENDPLRKTRAVVGWWVQWPDFVLHSVIERGGQLICITPTRFDESDFPFIPDPKISWLEDGDVYSAVRDGRVIGPGVRAFPTFTMARNAIVRERLIAGVDPFKAIEFSDEMMEALKREHCAE
ncbi:MULTISPECIES: hypothetical protein [Bradyrhizobium]|uniref:hypothetical protein n=1 Tax=Bradyrhizobium pachyrhizi TaxID=280333 RepID=UPI002AA5CF39